MFAQQIGQWFKSGVRRQEVKVGGVFRNILRGDMVETAKVIDIVPDSMGVPHVHFMVSIRSAHHECFKERRTLGLATFSERFPSATTA
jgi:hypothetical protein